MSKVSKKKTIKQTIIKDNNEDNNLNNNIELNKDGINFNKILSNAVKDKNLKVKKNNTDSKKSHNAYESSFDDIHSFRKSFTKREVDDIDVIIYHDENNDGMISAGIAYHYLKEHNPDKVIELIPEKPGKFTFKNKIIEKNILILDLSLNKDYLSEIIKVVKHYIVIDDHSKTLLNNPKIFNGNNHAACGYTWKFFYPKLNVPNAVLYIDNSDSKLFLPFIQKSYSTLYAQSTGIEFTHSKSKEMIMKKKSGDFFVELWDLISNDTKFNYYIALGYYYHKCSESLKEQIAINAHPAKFQGYDVGVLNFNAPLLTKPVARQIITNFKNQGRKIDFAVCWGYEYTANAYRIQLIDDHKQTSIRMDQIAQKLGEKGGTTKKGGGHPHVGNFYWAKKNNQDIWDLFSKKYI
jgi:hypothetical protein